MKTNYRKLSVVLPNKLQETIGGVAVDISDEIFCLLDWHVRIAAAAELTETRGVVYRIPIEDLIDEVCGE